MTNEATLLIEIGTEELPPNHIEKLSQALAREISGAFSNLGIPFTQVDNFAAPRRLAVRLFNVPSIQPGRDIKRRGPSLAGAYDSYGNPTPAAIGFAKSCGVDIAALKVEESPQVSWLYYEHHVNGKPTLELRRPMLQEAWQKVLTPKK